jgi:hypothetical protein
MTRRRQKTLDVYIYTHTHKLQVCSSHEKGQKTVAVNLIGGYASVVGISRIWVPQHVNKNISIGRQNNLDGQYTSEETNPLEGILTEMSC